MENACRSRPVVRAGRAPWLRLIFALSAVALATTVARAQGERGRKTVLVIHGGSEVLTREEMTPELRREYEKDLEQSLRAGHAVLERGASSLDAVEAAIKVLEDSPRFNAGRGAAFTRSGRNQLDASIMEGESKKAGAVAGVTIVKNPITAARSVMDHSPHVLMAGPSADEFAKEQGLEIVPTSYFRTEDRLKELEKQKKDGGRTRRGEPAGAHFGTVGAVALDRRGNLAAGGSTGGTTGQRDGRVGDTALIGSGVYADNEGCAVACTGEGEYFIRWAVAHDIVALVRYKNLSVEQAADNVVNEKLKRVGGEGGVIALDPQGRHVMTFNSKGMYRGYIGEDGTPHVAIYKDE
jgi:beta-aspartyl-peptidase (threonine type)